MYRSQRCRCNCRPEIITEYKRADAALRQSELLMRAINESTQDAILMMDVEGRISYWNTAADRIFGYTSDEALGQSLHYLLAPQHYHELFEAAYPEFQRSGHGHTVGQTLQLTALRKSGEEFIACLPNTNEAQARSIAERLRR